MTADLFHDTAVLTGEGFELCGIEVAASDHETIRVGRIGRGHRRDDVLNVALDIDTGGLLKLLLPPLVGHPLLQALAELGGHHFPDVGVGDDAGIGWNVGQFRGATA